MFSVTGDEEMDACSWLSSSLGKGLWKTAEIQVKIPGNQPGIGQLLGIGQMKMEKSICLQRTPGNGPIGNSGEVYKILPSNE